MWLLGFIVRTIASAVSKRPMQRGLPLHLLFVGLFHWRIVEVLVAPMVQAHHAKYSAAPVRPSLLLLYGLSAIDILVGRDRENAPHKSSHDLAPTRLSPSLVLHGADLRHAVTASWTGWTALIVEHALRPFTWIWRGRPNATKWR
jgi:hypothetical protein